MINGKRYYLVVIDRNDVYELPLFVGDTFPQCAEFLGCNVQTLYNHKSYNQYDIIIVEDVDNEPL